MVVDLNNMNHLQNMRQLSTNRTGDVDIIPIRGAVIVAVHAIEPNRCFV